MTPLLTLTVQRESLSGNALAYAHWRARMKDRDAWLIFLRAALARLPVWPQKATGKRRVEIVAYRKRKLDTDNLSSGLKHCRDCLTRLGLLVDDSPRWAVFVYDQGLYRRAGYRAPCTLIRIYPEAA